MVSGSKHLFVSFVTFLALVGTSADVFASKRGRKQKSVATPVPKKLKKKKSKKSLSKSKSPSRSRSRSLSLERESQENSPRSPKTKKRTTRNSLGQRDRSSRSRSRSYSRSPSPVSSQALEGKSEVADHELVSYCHPHLRPSKPSPFVASADRGGFGGQAELDVPGVVLAKTDDSGLSAIALATAESSPLVKKDELIENEAPLASVISEEKQQIAQVIVPAVDQFVAVHNEITVFHESKVSGQASSGTGDLPVVQKEKRLREGEVSDQAPSGTGDLPVVKIEEKAQQIDDQEEVAHTSMADKNNSKLALVSSQRHQTQTMGQKFCDAFKAFAQKVPGYAQNLRQATYASVLRPFLRLSRYELKEMCTLILKIFADVENRSQNLDALVTKLVKVGGVMLLPILVDKIGFFAFATYALSQTASLLSYAGFTLGAPATALVVWQMLVKKCQERGYVRA